MRTFFKKTLFFFIPMLAVWMICECFYRFVPTNYSEKEQLVRENYAEAKILILGNSHTFYGLNPSGFRQKAFNLANVSQGIYFDQLLLERHIGQFKKLGYVILNLEYTSLTQRDNSGEDRWRKYFYHAQMDLDVPWISSADPRKYSLALTQKLGTTLGYMQDYVQNGSLVSCTNSGWAANYRFKDRNRDLSDAAKSIAIKHEDGLSDISQNARRIRQMITLCEKHGIRVLVVSMPVSRFYADAVNRQKRRRISEFGQSLSQFSPNATYLDLFRDRRFKDSDFFDADHLNDIGAKKCSAIVSCFLSELDRNVNYGDAR